jgi:C_GCAxxG_C_C family probable redox protein
MMSKQLREQASEKAFNNFQSGFHCAESISQAIVDVHGGEADGRKVQRFAAGFQGGIGGTHEDICGALAGGIVAIGCLRGQREAGQDNQEIKELSTEFRRRFIAEFGSSNCQMILDRLSEREDGFDCKKLTAIAAGLLSEVLTESGL